MTLSALNRSKVFGNGSGFEQQAVSSELLAVSLFSVVMKDFKRLLIWQKAMDIVGDACKMAADFPSEEKYGLRSQVTTCAVSIAANIAEGSSREGEKEYRLGLTDEKRLSELLKMLEEEKKMLTAFIKTLNV